MVVNRRIMKLNLIFRSSCLVLSGVIVTPLSAAEFYQYINRQGHLEVANAIPSELVTNGYTVVDEQGQILRVIAAQLTPLQQKAKAAQDLLDEKNQARIDWEDDLMLRYASPRDVEYARDQKIRAIETNIASTKLNMDRLESQKLDLENQAANMERAGRVLSPKILKNLDIINEQIEGRRLEIESRVAERDSAREEFSLIMKKIRELYGLPAPAAVSSAPVKIDLSKIDH